MLPRVKDADPVLVIVTGTVAVVVPAAVEKLSEAALNCTAGAGLFAVPDREIDCDPEPALSVRASVAE
jgi:hypothetical protein